MATEALSLNVGLSGQFRKLLLDRCNADVAAAAIAAIAANGTEVEVLVEDGICLPNASMQSFPPHQGCAGSRNFKNCDTKFKSQPSLADVKVGIEWSLPGQRLREGRARQTEMANLTLRIHARLMIFHI